MGSHRFCSLLEWWRIWNDLHVMSQTIDPPYNPHAGPSNFDGMWLRRTGWRCVRVRGLVMMVFVFVFLFVFWFEDRRSCRHVVDPKGHRRKDARLIQVIIK